MNILFNAVSSLSPNANFYVENGVVTWNSLDIEMPSQAEIDAEVTKLQAEQAATQYQRDRTYPTWQEQMDMQYHDQLNGTTTWKDAVAKVKADHPKG
jgi:hypothetical protein